MGLFVSCLLIVIGGLFGRARHFLGVKSIAMVYVMVYRSEFTEFGYSYFICNFGSMCGVLA